MNLFFPSCSRRHSSRALRPLWWSFFLLVGLGLSATLARAEVEPRSAGGEGHPSAVLPGSQVLAAPHAASAWAPPLAEGWWSRTSTFLLSHLKSRAGMLQFGAVGMLIALGIIWWRK